MDRFKNAHLWLLIPFAVAIFGFIPSYWSRFFEAPWRHHMHGLTATAWFILVIVQPYLATRGRLATHRRVGIIALMLAGAVIVSALGAIPYNFLNENMIAAAQYGLSFLDIILVSGFTMSVVMAMRTVRNVEDHARWMISTVFWSIFPALFRLSFLPASLIFGDNIPFPLVLVAMGVLNLLVVLFLMFRDRRAHPAYVAVALSSVAYVLPMPVAGMSWWRTLADALFTV